MADASAIALTELPSKSRPAKSASALIARLRRLLLPALSIAACVVIWHVLATQRAHLYFITFANVPTPEMSLKDFLWETRYQPFTTRRPACCG